MYRRMYISNIYLYLNSSYTTTVTYRRKQLFLEIHIIKQK